MSNIKFCNLSFSGINKERLNNHLFKTNEFTQVVTVNAEFIVEAQKNDKLRNIIDNSLSTIDGQVPFFFAKKLTKHSELEKVSGSDYVYDLLSIAEKNGFRVFVLGGDTESNKHCVDAVSKMYNIAAGGFSPVFEDYPFSMKNQELIMNRIKDFSPDVLLVCFGAVKQEFWISDNSKFLYSIGCNFAIGCGGTVDFLSGRLNRAPLFIQKIGLEGVYRLVMEPRLFRLKRLIKSLSLFRYIW